jgi:hypothetical protein
VSPQPQNLDIATFFITQKFLKEFDLKVIDGFGNGWYYVIYKNFVE